MRILNKLVAAVIAVGAPVGAAPPYGLNIDPASIDPLAIVEGLANIFGPPNHSTTRIKPTITEPAIVDPTTTDVLESDPEPNPEPTEPAVVKPSAKCWNALLEPGRTEVQWFIELEHIPSNEIAGLCSGLEQYRWTNENDLGVHCSPAGGWGGAFDCGPKDHVEGSTTMAMYMRARLGCHDGRMEEIWRRAGGDRWTVIDCPEHSIT